MSATTRITPPGRSLELNLGDVWAYRELLYFFIWRDLKVRYEQTIIGIAWVILQPVLSMIVFTLLFGRLAGLPSDGLAYPIFYFAGLLPWMFFSQSASRATNALVDNQRVITKVYFPRILLPIAAVLGGLVDFAIGFAVLAGAAAVYGGALGGPFWARCSSSWPWPPPSRSDSGSRRLRPLSRRALRRAVLLFAMFVSPVAYPGSLVPAAVALALRLNPMAGVIDGVGADARRQRSSGHDAARGLDADGGHSFSSAASCTSSASVRTVADVV
jgi:lipopolysaccharide transport system permease protein